MPRALHHNAATTGSPPHRWKWPQAGDSVPPQTRLEPSSPLPLPVHTIPNWHAMFTFNKQHKEAYNAPTAISARQLWSGCHQWMSTIAYFEGLVRNQAISEYPPLLILKVLLEIKPSVISAIAYFEGFVKNLGHQWCLPLFILKVLLEIKPSVMSTIAYFEGFVRNQAISDVRHCLFWRFF